MLDEKTTVLLDILNKKCANGVYQIIEIDELILQFPIRFNVDKDIMYQMIITLSQNGYITIRYDRDGEFCLSLTQKGQDVLQKTPDTPPKKSAITGLLPHFFNFLTVFLAAILAIIFLKIIGVIC